MPDRLKRREPSFDLEELPGTKVAAARERCERDGFDVQVIDLEKTSARTLEFRPNRIRLLARRGVVERCHQG